MAINYWKTKERFIYQQRPSNNPWALQIVHIRDTKYNSYFSVTLYGDFIHNKYHSDASIFEREFKTINGLIIAITDVIKSYGKKLVNADDEAQIYSAIEELLMKG